MSRCLLCPSGRVQTKSGREQAVTCEGGEQKGMLIVGVLPVLCVRAVITRVRAGHHLLRIGSSGKAAVQAGLPAPGPEQRHVRAVDVFCLYCQDALTWRYSFQTQLLERTCKPFVDMYCQQLGTTDERAHQSCLRLTT